MCVCPSGLVFVTLRPPPPLRVAGGELLICSLTQRPIERHEIYMILPFLKRPSWLGTCFSYHYYSPRRGWSKVAPDIRPYALIDHSRIISTTSRSRQFHSCSRFQWMKKKMFRFPLSLRPKNTEVHCRWGKIWSAPTETCGGIFVCPPPRHLDGSPPPKGDLLLSSSMRIYTHKVINNFFCVCVPTGNSLGRTVSHFSPHRPAQTPTK